MPDFLKSRNNPQRRNQGVFLRTTGGGAAFQPSFIVQGTGAPMLLITKDGDISLANYDYAKYKISDGSGNEVFGVFDDLDSKSVNLSGLYLSEELKIVITIKEKATGIVKEVTGEYQYSNIAVTLGAFIEANVLGSRAAARTGGVVKLQVFTNQSFNINDLPEWATVKTTQLHGSQIVDITIAAGAGAASADISLEAAYGKLVPDITIERS